MPTKMFGVYLSKEESLEKGIKKIGGRKVGKDKAYLGYEIGFYKRSPIIIFQTMLPIVIIPIFMIMGAYTGMSKNLEAEEERYSNYEYVVAETGEEKHLNIIEMVKNDGPDKTLDYLTKEGAEPTSSIIDISRVVQHLNNKKNLSFEGIMNFVKTGIRRNCQKINKPRNNWNNYNCFWYSGSNV